MRFIIFVICSALLVLPACTGPLDTGPGLDVISDGFCAAMRWRDFIGAGNYLKEDVRNDFLDQFQQDEDLHVVDSRIEQIKLNSETGIAEADYRLEYYRLPSMRVKKWQWTQQWQLISQEALKASVWQIINRPPPLL